MVAAVADNGVIGLGGDIPWQISADLKHFRATTTGHTVLMGRRTYESIGHPLPYRTNVVITRDTHWTAEGVFVAHDVKAAIELAEDFEGDVMVIGGGQVYVDAMPFATHQVLTEVHLEPDGDTFYPGWDRADWQETQRDPHLDADPPLEFVWWERKALQPLA
jgi:dihydrofolate reductase